MYEQHFAEGGAETLNINSALNRNHWQLIWRLSGGEGLDFSCFHFLSAGFLSSGCFFQIPIVRANACLPKVALDKPARGRSEKNQGYHLNSRSAPIPEHTNKALQPHPALLQELQQTPGWPPCLRLCLSYLCEWRRGQQR